MASVLIRLEDGADDSRLEAVGGCRQNEGVQRGPAKAAVKLLRATPGQTYINRDVGAIWLIALQPLREGRCGLGHVL